LGEFSVRTLWRISHLIIQVLIIARNCYYFWLFFILYISTKSFKVTTTISSNSFLQLSLSIDQFDLVKVHMKRNQCFNIFKVQRFKDPIPKFEPRLKKSGDFIMPEHRAAKMSGHVAWWRSVVDKIRDCNMASSEKVRRGTYKSGQK